MAIEVFDTIDGIRQHVQSLKADGKRVAFVPTMGALHKGHLSLMREAHQHADAVVVSIFVNPTQFGPDEDYENYPRDFEDDLAKCESEDVNAVYNPTKDSIYLDEQLIGFTIDTLGDTLCGASRNGHFEGVIQIVNKLFNIVQPDVAVFGQKDIQQFVILDRMVKEFNHDIELVRGTIIRANDGLALSSRNKYLNDEERKIAPALYRCLTYVGKQIEDGVKNVNLLLEHQKSELEAKGFEIDYLQVVTLDTLSPVDTLDTGEYIVAGAVYLGSTRLIDNIIVDV